MSKSKIYSSLNPSTVYQLKGVLGEGSSIISQNKVYQEFIYFFT